MEVIDATMTHSMNLPFLELSRINNFAYVQIICISVIIKYLNTLSIEALLHDIVISRVFVLIISIYHDNNAIACYVITVKYLMICTVL